MGAGLSIVSCPVGPGDRAGLGSGRHEGERTRRRPASGGSLAGRLTRDAGRAASGHSSIQASSSSTIEFAAPLMPWTLSCHTESSAIGIQARNGTCSFQTFWISAMASF